MFRYSFSSVSWSAPIAAVAAFLALGLPSEARADDSKFPPMELVKRPQVNSEGQFELRGVVSDGLSKGNVGKPLIAAPSLYYGVTPDLTLGLAHTNSLCLYGCDKAYNDVGLDALYSLLRGPFSLSAHAGLFGASLDPFFSQARVGALLTIAPSDMLAIYLDPQVFFGLTNRDLGNKEQLSVPTRVALQFNQNLAGFVDTGIFGVLSSFGDTWYIPGGVGALYAFSNRFDVGARFRFDNLIAAHNGGIDARTAMGFVNYRF